MPEVAVVGVDIRARHFGALLESLSAVDILPRVRAYGGYNVRGPRQSNTELRDRETDEDYRPSEDHHFARPPVRIGVTAPGERDMGGYTDNAEAPASQAILRDFRTVLSDIWGFLSTPPKRC